MALKDWYTPVVVIVWSARIVTVLLRGFIHLEILLNSKMWSPIDIPDSVTPLSYQTPAIELPLRSRSDCRLRGDVYLQRSFCCIEAPAHMHKGSYRSFDELSEIINIHAAQSVIRTMIVRIEVAFVLDPQHGGVTVLPKRVMIAVQLYLEVHCRPQSFSLTFYKNIHRNFFRIFQTTERRQLLRM